MRKIIFALSVVGMFLFPSITFAHGGMDKEVGEYVIHFSQDPMSPLVGEVVKINFVFLIKNSNVRIGNLPVSVSIIETYHGDESKDQKILEKEFKTDTNGSLDFVYTFNKENYFDIELSFKDPSGRNLETGFLVQSRSYKKGDNFIFLTIIAIIAFLTGSVLTFATLRNKKKSKKR